ncbi:MAG: 3-coathanger stack domain-containing protein, partial [Bacteroidia bacterium]
MRYFIIFILLFSISKFVDAQSNIEKYWYYRQRIQDGFIKYGENIGESMLADIRNAYKNENVNPPVYSNMLRWGQHSIYMGWYIGVLATEYKLLKDAGKNTDRTLMELYYCLYAIDRLDEYSNRPPPTNQPNSSVLDGYFIRDDVPSNFLDDNLDHFNKNVSYHNYDLVAGEIESDYTADDERAKEMSQDELYHLMIGLALVKHFVENEPKLIKKIDGTFVFENLNERARNFVHRAVNRIKNDFWLIRNPQNQMVYNNGGTVAPALPYGLAEAAKFITGYTYIFPCCTPNYLLYFNNWQLLQDISGFGGLLALNSDNLHMVTTLAAIGNSWCEVPEIVGECLVNSTVYKLPALASVYGWETFYPLLRQVLYGGVNPVPNSMIENHLNSAPCKGPYNTGSSNFAPSGWASSHRFFHPQSKQNGNVGPFRGYYNGVDYMLLHNLYQIVNPSNNLPQFLDFLDRELNSPTDNFPKHIGMGLYIGTNATPATVEAFRSITANNTIQSNANVTYRAGEEIVLKDGFVAHAGSEFRAYIQPFTCNGNDYNAVNPNNPNNPNANENSSIALDALLTEEGLYGMHNKYIEKQKPIDYSGVPINYPLNIENYNNISSITSIVQSSESFKLFPNPNTGTFTIYVQTLNEQEQLQLSVMDVYGKQLLAQQINNSV